MHPNFLRSIVVNSQLCRPIRLKFAAYGSSFLHTQTANAPMSGKKKLEPVKGQQTLFAAFGKKDKPSEPVVAASRPDTGVVAPVGAAAVGSESEAVIASPAVVAEPALKPSTQDAAEMPVEDGSDEDDVVVSGKRKLPAESAADGGPSKRQAIETTTASASPTPKPVASIFAKAAASSSAGAGASSSSSSSSSAASSSSTAAASSSGRKAKKEAAASAAAEADEDELDDVDSDEGEGSGKKAGKGGKGKGSGTVTQGALDAAAACGSYHPIRDAPWNAAGSPELKAGTSIPFASLVRVFEACEATTKRLEMTKLLANFLRSLIAQSPDDLLPALYLCTNEIAPAYMGLETGVGDSILVKAVTEATGRQAKDIKAEMERLGDLGSVAETSRSKQKTLFGSLVPAKAPGSAGVTVAAVFATYKAIAAEKGHASQDKKIGAIKKLLVAGSGPEAKYIIRGLQGKLRIGLAKQTVLVALAHAFTMTQPLMMPEAQAQVEAGAEGAADSGASSGAGAGSSASSSSSSSTAPPSASSSSSSSSSSSDCSVPVDIDTLRAALSLPASCEVLARPNGYPPVLLDARKRFGGAGSAANERMGAALEAAVVTLKQVFSELPSYDAIVPPMLRRGVDGARAVCQLTPGIPVAPMLAKPTRGVREILDRFSGTTFTCEWKYDGERAQVHVTPEGGVRIFSRNSEDTSSKYPDLGIMVRAALGADTKSCILDGEVIAYDREKGCLLPFQVLSTRARKDVTMESIKVQVIYVAFDLLYLNGASLLATPLAERRALLRGAFKEMPGQFGFAVASESSDVDEIGTFLNDAVKGGCEGLMVKVLEGRESAYEPSKRSLNWLKLKKDYMDGLTDTFDLVPIAAWRGKGKRTGAYGAYLLACYDPEEEVWQAITKVGTGFTDDMLGELTAAFDASGAIRTSRPKDVLAGDMGEVDVWFDPHDSEVWEVAAADLSISPVHMAAVGKVAEDKGIALRFPRFLRRRPREDKGVEQATSADQVAEMYRNQGVIKGAAGGGDDDDDDM